MHPDGNILNRDGIQDINQNILLNQLSNSKNKNGETEYLKNDRVVEAS